MLQPRPRLHIPLTIAIANPKRRAPLNATLNSRIKPIAKILPHKGQVRRSRLQETLPDSFQLGGLGSMGVDVEDVFDALPVRNLEQDDTEAVNVKRFAVGAFGFVALVVGVDVEHEIIGKLHRGGSGLAFFVLSGLFVAGDVWIRYARGVRVGKKYHTVAS